MSRFYEGQKVVCINDKFPVIATTEVDKSIIGLQPIRHPQMWEAIIINEMLGDEWLRFDRYDAETFNWWHITKFKPLDEIKIEHSLINYEMNENHLHQ